MLIIKGGTLIDPLRGVRENCDILIEGGRIKKIGRDLSPEGARVIDARGAVVAPGFIDLHVHFRDPGQTYKEDIETGSRAAVAGGYTTVVCMPNTTPPIDSPPVAEYVRRRSREVGLCEVLPAGTLTVGRKGERLSDFFALRAAGCVAFTDDGSPLISSSLMRRALELCSQLNVPVMNHCEDPELSGGEINEGEVSALLGVSGRHPSAEEVIVARDCILSYHTGGHVHLQHLTTALSIQLVGSFKEKGARVTCEVNPLHLFLTEEEVLRSGALAKVNPPLRRKEDVEALRKALADGTVDCIATDHAPHHPSEKGLLESSLPGMIGLQTALPLMLSLVREGIIDLPRMVELMSTNPARILGLEGGVLEEGCPADLVIFDPEAEWELGEEELKSKSRNTPLLGASLRGKVLYTLKGGRVVFSESANVL